MLRTIGIVVLSGFMALVGLVTPFLDDPELGYRPGFVLVFLITVVAGSWVGFGAPPIGRWLRVRLGSSAFVTRFLDTPVDIWLLGVSLGTFLRLVGWPLALGLVLGLAYGQTLTT